MKFEESPVIPTTTLFREARVSPTKGNCVLSQLRLEGHVHTAKTPTGRNILTPREGRIVFEALTK